MGEAVQQAMLGTLKLMEVEDIVPSTELVSSSQQPESLAAVQIQVASDQLTNHQTDPTPPHSTSAHTEIHIPIPTVTASIIEQAPEQLNTADEPIATPNPCNVITEYNMIVEDFLTTLEAPIQQPIIEENFQPHTLSEEGPDDPSYTSVQRKSIRLAKKAELNAGKDTVQVAHDLLVKKLGELARESPSEEEHDFDFYAQHFQRPIELEKMEAIQTLIEEGQKKKKARASSKGRVAKVGLEA